LNLRAAQGLLIKTTQTGDVFGCEYNLYLCQLIRRVNSYIETGILIHGTYRFGILLIED